MQSTDVDPHNYPLLHLPLPNEPSSERAPSHLSTFVCGGGGEEARAGDKPAPRPLGKDDGSGSGDSMQMSVWRRSCISPSSLVAKGGVGRAAGEEVAWRAGAEVARPAAAR